VLTDVAHTILVVDDEQPVVEVVAGVLEYAGYRVLTAGNGKLALAYLEKGKVDLVLSDMMMPVMDGTELCKRITADAAFSSIPFVLMSATYTAARLDGCRYSAFLRKPFDMQELLRTVASVLGE
jgi:CheY-like chemotaxis protein